MTERVESLADLNDRPVWLAWRGELKGDLVQKIPYSPHGGMGDTSDPKTWGVRSAAEKVAAKIVNGLGGGGGVVLGIGCGEGLRLGGVDLDTCLTSPSDIEEWASDVITRFGSLTEISPSGTGAKIFFLYREADIERLHAMMTGDKKSGRQFKRPSSGNHPPAIEVYISHRYFAVTDNVLGDLSELHIVEIDDLIWLLQEYGPAFVGDRPSSPRDQSRSGAAFRAGLAARRAGKSFDEMVAALQAAAPEISAWARTKGAARGGRELKRIWEKAGILLSGPPWSIALNAPLDIAQLFLDARHMVDDLRALHRHRGVFYSWNGKTYSELPEDEARAALYRFLDECVTRSQDEEGNWQQHPVKPNARLVNNILDALRAAALLPATIEAPAWLDGRDDRKPKDIIACANGLLYLPTLELLPHTPTFFTHNAIDIAYDPKAPKPVVWLGFLDQLWSDDAESIETLQDIFGYCLGADTDQQKAFMLVGPPRSGKGTITRVETALVGGENTVSPTLAGLGERFGLQPLIGKRLAIISDARLSGKTDQAVIAERLLSITGEDGLTIDRKNRDAWTGRLKTRFVILTNELPRVADVSGAFASRFIVLVLTVSFYGREDLSLGNRLLAEMPGILNWAIEGWQRLRRRGHFIQPASAEEAARELEDLGSPIGAFLRDRCAIGPAGDVAVDDLFGAWERWCSDQNRQHPGDKQTFGRNLRAAIPGITIKRHRIDGGRTERYYPGIRLKTESERGTMSPEEEEELIEEERDRWPVDDEVPF